MAWGSKTQIANAVSVNNTTDDDSVFPNFAGSAITLNPGEAAQVQVSATFASAAVDPLLVRAVATLDDSSEVWDEFALTAITIPVEDGGTASRSFVVSGCYKFRLEFRKRGTAAETITVSADVRTDGVSL